jgi:hypothetical protein
MLSQYAVSIGNNLINSFMTFSPQPLPNLAEFPFTWRAQARATIPDALFMALPAWPQLPLPNTVSFRLVGDSIGDSSYLLITGLPASRHGATPWLTWAAADPSIVWLYTVYQRGDSYILVECGQEILAESAAIAQYGAQWSNQTLILRAHGPHLIINPTPPVVDPTSLQTYRLALRLIPGSSQPPTKPLLMMQLVAKESYTALADDETIAIVASTAQTRQALRQWAQRQAGKMSSKVAFYQDEYRTVIIQPANRLPRLPYGALLVRAYYDAEQQRQIFLPHTHQLSPTLPASVIWTLFDVHPQETVLLFAATATASPQKLVINSSQLFTGATLAAMDVLNGGAIDGGAA